jgi:hypothetical protein
VTTPEALPDDIAALMRIIADMARDAVSARTEIARLKFQLARYRRVEFGRSSETLARETEQLELAIETLETDQAERLSTAETPASVESAAETQKPARRSLPESPARRATEPPQGLVAVSQPGTRATTAEGFRRWRPPDGQDPIRDADRRPHSSRGGMRRSPRQQRPFGRGRPHHPGAAPRSPPAASILTPSALRSRHGPIGPAVIACAEQLTIAKLPQAKYVDDFDFIRHANQRDDGRRYAEMPFSPCNATP